MDANAIFQPVTERGPWLGFANLFANENSRWWNRRRWWVQLIIWTIILNGTLLAVMLTMPGASRAAGQELTPDQITQNGIELFLNVSILAVALGAILLAQDAIIKEKQSGTAEWILSKPASRSAYYLSKLFANAIGIFVLLILAQSALAYLIISTAGNAPDLLPYLKGILVMTVHSAFYLSLTLMLGVLFNARGAVLGISMGLLFGGQLTLNFLPRLMYYTPFGLGNLAGLAASGAPMPPELNLPIYLTAAWVLLFTAVALWRINKMEV